jgi:hypothetical protein
MRQDSVGEARKSVPSVPAAGGRVLKEQGRAAKFSVWLPLLIAARLVGYPLNGLIVEWNLPNNFLMACN